MASSAEHMTSQLWAELLIHRAALKLSGAQFEVPLAASACPLPHPRGRRAHSSPCDQTDSSHSFGNIFHILHETPSA